MSAVLDSKTLPGQAAAPTRRVVTNSLEPRWVRYALIAVALLFLTLFLFVPLVAVFAEALKKGWDVYVESVLDPDAIFAADGARLDPGGAAAGSGSEPAAGSASAASLAAVTR